MTLVEMLVVLAILGILATLGFVRITAPSSRLVANDLKGLLEQARYDSVRLHVPVAVTWDAATESFVTRVQASTAMTLQASLCNDSTAIVRRHGTQDYRRLTISNVGVPGLLAGVIWLPSALVMDCGGNELGSSAGVRLWDGRREVVVTLWPAGAVTIQ
jgi:prepilin-type N-terminal cleavage/methylation domain-containing protein